MRDINRHNFLEKYESIKKNIEDAKFISIDCEFTGLVENPLFKNSLFDSSNERYLKLKEATQGFIIVQIGVTTFKHVPQENLYETNVYNFQLCPRWYGSDEKILLQPSCLVFLCAHKFDFNEFIYNGISYLNNDNQLRVKHDLDSGTWFKHIEHPFLGEDEAIIQNVCSAISRWLQKNSSTEESLKIPLNWADDKYVMDYVLLFEVVNKFLKKGVCAFLKEKEIHMEKFNFNDCRARQSRVKMQQDLLSSAKTLAWRSMSGFSEVFQLLTKSQKPIIGHNLLTDLLFMYKQFHKPLPSNLKQFKLLITELFPHIYDTKFISYEVNQKLDKGKRWNSNSLNELYMWLRDRTHVTHLLLYVPKVALMQPGATDAQPKLHQAGWDSYLTGYSFVHLIYMLSSLKHNLPTIIKPYTLTDQLASVKPYENKINLIRANVNHLNLSGTDPKSSRPAMLVVFTRDGTRIVLDEVVETFADFGTVDVRYFGYDSALVAVGNYVCLRLALEKLRIHTKYEVRTYNSTKNVILHALYNVGYYSVLIGGASLIFLMLTKCKV